jgi:hypothetical protein
MRHEVVSAKVKASALATYSAAIPMYMAQPNSMLHSKRQTLLRVIGGYKKESVGLISE